MGTNLSAGPIASQLQYRGDEMSKPYEHAKNSVRKWGGTPEDYLPVHDFFDQTKAAHPDMRHRAILHNSMGCFLAEQLYGHNITNSDGRLVSVRDIAEQHILEDMGFIPTVSDYLNGMPLYDWLGGKKKPTRTLRLSDLENVKILD
jgi:hypothetical protein